MVLTIKEALTGIVNFPIPESRVAKALIDAGLDGNAVYAKTEEKDIDLCMAGLLLTLASPKKVTEGGYSIEMPSASELRLLRKDLLLKWGIVEDEEPLIYDGSNLW
jgi:hypothetical protein